MAKISDEMREWAELWRKSMSIAGRIAAEMVELPRGEDGKAWHVRGVTIGEKSTAHPGHVIRAASDAGQPRYLKPEWLTHERPDSWERIADELDAWCDKVDVDGDACGKPRAIADRIRRLAEKEGQQ